MAAESYGDTSILRHLLFEREKELDALYHLAVLFTQPVRAVEPLLTQTAEILRSALQFPEWVTVEIFAENYHVRSGAQSTTGETYRVERRYSLEKTAAVAVAHLTSGEAHNAATLIVERERHLVDSTAALLANVLEREDMHQILRESTKALQHQAAELENKNTALREVLAHIESEKHQMRQQARTYIDTFVAPYLHDLSTRLELTEDGGSRLSQVQAALRNLFTGDSPSIPPAFGTLSPRETEICGLIRNGLATKQIAAFLHITEKTVERHRNTIRKKLHINGRKVNLVSYLRSLE